MINHFHLVVETPEATLSDGMHFVDGEFAKWVNRKRKRSGHLFQGRFHSFLIEKQAYLMEVMRYVALNPVRAKLVELSRDRWVRDAAAGARRDRYRQPRAVVKPRTRLTLWHRNPRFNSAFSTF